MLFLPELNDFEIENISVTELLVQLTLRPRVVKAECPLCAMPAHRIQSHYMRTLADLPLSGRRLQLQLLITRFYCDNPVCLRRIFAERFPTLTVPYAQRTNRLSHNLLQIGLVLGGEAGAALAHKLGMLTSPDTLLRLIRANQPTLTRLAASQAALTKIGIDDWSWKRGVRFGTIIVDLDSHKVVDLLADRTRETVSKWLADHPKIKVISRDRSTEYASAASQGAPQAIQVADRFHIVRNLVEQVELLLARLHREWCPDLGLDDQLALREREEESPKPKELPSPTSWKVTPSQQTERKRLARRIERMERYDQVVQLRAAGLQQIEIASRTGLSERTVRKLLQASEFPEAQVRSKRHSIFDRYADYVLKRWQAGQHDGHQIWEEIAAQGFKGSERTVQRYLAQLRDNKQQPLELSPASVLEGLKARKAVWWFIRNPVRLSETETQNLKLLLQASPIIAEIYQLVQSFMEMVWQLKGERLEGWLAQVKASGFEELDSFARGIEKDKAAVLAGLSLSYNNGLVEGQNNRLKLIKRSMFGRAKLDLLKQRVLAST
ncbi:MAG: ISL3 family transposase [Chloroflexota bacterium]|nr:ISL3 family transposase [Chloroflexota bacterium]